MSRQFARRLAISCLLLSLAAPFGPRTARADGDGQAALDQAIEAKLSVEGLDDLSEVIRLCRSALRRGLDEKNKVFASEMLAGTLTQRAEIVCSEIFDRPSPTPRWPELRRLALADLDESLQLNDKQGDAQYMVGRLNALPGGDRDDALKALDAAVKLSAKEPPARSKALLIRATLQEDDDKRLADLNEAVMLTPHSANALRARGLYYMSKDQFDPALVDLNQAIELDPTSADNYEGKGVVQFLMKDYDAALKTLDKAVELDPDSALTYSHRARIYAIRGDNDKALTEMSKALELQPRAIDFLMLRARIYQQARKYEKGLIDVNQVLRLSPGLEEALKLHALLAAGSGRIDQAISDLEELNIETPNDTELMLQLALFYAADKQPQKAVDTYGEVLAKDPKSWMAYRGRADAYLSLGKQSDALSDYEAALKLRPDDSGILNNLAWLLGTSTVDQVRNGKRAIELATEACKLTEYKQAHILSTLAAGYAENGDFETAMRWSRKAVDLGGTPAMKEQLAKELDSYKQRKPWREETPPNLAVESDDDADEAVQDAADKPVDDASSTADEAAPSESSLDKADVPRKPSRR